MNGLKSYSEKTSLKYFYDAGIGDHPDPDVQKKYPTLRITYPYGYYKLIQGSMVWQDTRCNCRIRTTKSEDSVLAEDLNMILNGFNRFTRAIHKLMGQMEIPASAYEE